MALDAHSSLNNLLLCTRLVLLIKFKQIQFHCWFWVHCISGHSVTSIFHLRNLARSFMNLKNRPGKLVDTDLNYYQRLLRRVNIQDRALAVASGHREERRGERVLKRSFASAETSQLLTSSPERCSNLFSHFLLSFKISENPFLWRQPRCPGFSASPTLILLFVSAKYCWFSCSSKRKGILI